MITRDNYFEKTTDINFDELPEALRSGHRLTSGSAQNNWKVYQDNETIQRVVDTYIQKLNEYLQKHAASSTARAKTKNTEPKPKTATKTVKPKTQKAAPKKTVKTSAQKTEPKPKAAPHTNADSVPFISHEVRFIKRFLRLNGTTKTKKEILAFVKSLQRAIIEKRIKKTSGYAKEIETIQEQLVSCYNSMEETVAISFQNNAIEKYTNIAQSEQIEATVRLIKQCITLQSRGDVQKQALSLFKRIQKAVNEGDISKDDVRFDEVKTIMKSLADFIEGRSNIVSITEAELNGLMGIVGITHAGLSGVEAEKPNCISSVRLKNMEFETIGLQGKYRKLIGDPSVGFTAMVHGLPKSGKSTLCIDFARHLAEHHGRVLYAAIEEGFGYTLKEKFERLNAIHPNLVIADKLPENLSMFDFVFIDSVSKAAMTIEQMVRLHKQFPKTAFIFIFHSTKDGKFRGSQGFAHEVDCIIDVENGIARGNGRFGVGGEINVFND